MALVCPAPSHAEDETASAPLIISALDWQDEPIEGVAFRVSWNGGGEDPLVTDELGQARLEAAAFEVPATVRLDDPAWDASMDEIDVGATAPLALFTLFRSDPNEMRPGERLAYIRQLDYRSRYAPDSPIVPLLSLAQSYRNDQIEPSPPPTDEERDSRGVSVRLLDPAGEPMSNVLVYLYLYDQKNDAARLGGFERTDVLGQAVFSGLPGGMLYRLEATDNGMVGRSSFGVTPAHGSVLTGPMVMRPEEDVVDGIVAIDGVPAEGASVVLQGGSRQLATRTDEHGYFQLAPVASQQVRLLITVTEPDRKRTAIVRIDADEGEVFLPLEILAP